MEDTKKNYFLMNSPLRGVGGEGARGCHLRKKKLFLILFLDEKNFFCPLRQGGGDKGFSGLSTKRRNFLVLFLVVQPIRPLPPPPRLSGH